jgi:hypothetical protein
MSLKRHSHAGVMGPPAKRVRGNKGTANAQADTTKKASQRGKDKAADTSDVGGRRRQYRYFGRRSSGRRLRQRRGRRGSNRYVSIRGGRRRRRRERRRRNWVGDAAVRRCSVRRVPPAALGARVAYVLKKRHSHAWASWRRHARVRRRGSSSASSSASDRQRRGKQSCGKSGAKQRRCGQQLSTRQSLRQHALVASGPVH